MINYLIIVTKL